ncbi:MAG: biotin--[acetyl-CoA-carboxylase] ligase [Phycisphaerae bacterium]
MTEPIADLSLEKRILPAFNEVKNKAILQVLTTLFNNGVVPYRFLKANTGLDVSDIACALEFLRRMGCDIVMGDVGVRLVRLGFAFISLMLDIMLGQEGIDIAVQTFAEIGSTNDECFAAAAKGIDKPLAVIANVQTNGRGRRGNRWEAKPGQSALLSLLLPARELPVETLSLAAGLAVAESIAKMTHRTPELKWPNDVLLDDRKIAGILIETRPNAKNPARTDYVIGVGVNVMQTHKDFPRELATRAISLGMINRGEWEITNVILNLLVDLHCLCNPLMHGDDIVPLWRSRCHMLGRSIRVACAGSVLEGTVADIDPLEGLILRDQHGLNHACLASQTTILSQ